MTARSQEKTPRIRPSQVGILQEATLRLTRRIRKHSETELTLSQMSALSTMQRVGTMRVGDLARREHISKSSVTRLVAKLEVMGYLAREVDPNDARSFQVTITDHGHQQLSESRRRANDFLASEVARLPERQRKALIDALPALQELVAPRH